jgi:hypothetical protein
MKEIVAAYFKVSLSEFPGGIEVRYEIIHS